MNRYVEIEQREIGRKDRLSRERSVRYKTENNVNTNKERVRLRDTERGREIERERERERENKDHPRKISQLSEYSANPTPVSVRG